MLPHVGQLPQNFNSAGTQAQPDEAPRPRTRQEARLVPFDRLRVRSYPNRARYQFRLLWQEHVLRLARVVNAELGVLLQDRDVFRIAVRHARWGFNVLSHFKFYRHDSSCQAWMGTLSGKVRRHRIRPRDVLIVELLSRRPGTTFRAVARAAGISATQVMRVVRRDAEGLYASIRRRFRARGDRMRWTISSRMLRRYRLRWRDHAQGK